MAELYTKFDGVFFEKTRLSMLTVLFQEEAVSFNRFKKIIGGTDGAIYTHLEKLLKAGYVGKRKEIAGTAAQTVYFLTSEGKREFRNYLKFLTAMLRGGMNEQHR